MIKTLAVTCGLLLLASGLVFAQAPAMQNPPVTGQAVQPAPAPVPAPQAQAWGWGPRFVDANGDGVCDYWPARGRMFANRTATGWGPFFVDNNGDGVCDNFPGPGRLGQGRGLGPGAGRGRGVAATGTVYQTGVMPLAGAGRGRGWWRR